MSSELSATSSGPHGGWSRSRSATRRGPATQALSSDSGLFPCRRSRPCARSLPGPGSGCDTQTLLVFLALVYAQGLGLACEFQRTRVLQIKSIAVQDCRAHSVSGRRTT